MGGLSIGLLGSLTVEVDGRPISNFEYNKVKGLLAYLVVETESPHRREALAGFLWPDQSQKAALDSLRNALSRLRQAIGDHQANPPNLLITKDSIQFNQASDHWLDKAHFLHLLEATTAHHHRRIECCVSCAERLEQAAALYRGEFLEGFYLTDSDLFNDWVLRKRVKLSQVASDALSQLVSIYERQGKYTHALDYAHKLLDIDSCNEEAHTQVMRLLASIGKRSEACAQYEKCCTLLKKELGVELIEDSTHLYEQIKYGMFHPAPTLETLRVNNLPPNLTSFVGREKELKEISTLMDDPSCRLLTLVGPGGVGKTRLAFAAAMQQMEAFPHGVCFVSLAGINSVGLIIPTILQAFNLKQSEQGDLKKQLIEYLKDKELLLLLDNFEHLVEGAEMVTEILQNSPGSLVLVTSRQRLGLQAEWSFEVNGLSYPSAKATQDLAAYESVQLFMQRLHQVKPRQTVFDNDLPSMTRICQLVEGLPLGVELAASAVRRRSIDQVATAIESGKEDLKVSYKDIPERHRSLRAVFEHSYRLLSEEEQAAFVGLAVFRGGFTAEAAEQVAGATPDILDALVEHSLVRYNPEKERYFIHELVRQYAEEKLIAQDSEVTIRLCHLNYYIDLAEQAEAYQIKTDHWEHYMGLTPEDDNFRTALSWCLINEKLDQIIQLSGALGSYWSRIGHWQEGDAWMTQILNSKQTFTHNYYFARALMSAGVLAKYRDINSSLALHKESLPIWRALGDQQGIAMTSGIIGHKLMLKGEFKKSRKYLEKAIQLFRHIGDQARVANYMNTLGTSYFCEDYRNNLDKARTLLEESIKINRKLDIKENLANTLNNYNVIEMNLGNFQIARSSLEESLALFEDKNYGDTTTYTLDSLGLACFYLGDFSSARSYLEWSIEIAQNIGMKNTVSKGDLCYLLYNLGEHEHALLVFKELFGELDFGVDMHSAILDGVLEHLPGVLLPCGEPARAAKLFAYTDYLREKQNASLPNYMRQDYGRDLAETRRQLGEAAFAKAWAEGRAMTLEQAKACALGAKVRINEANV